MSDLVTVTYINLPTALWYELTSCRTSSPVIPTVLSYSTVVNFELDFKGVLTGFALINHILDIKSSTYSLIENHSRLRSQHLYTKKISQFTKVLYFEFLMQDFL